MKRFVFVKALLCLLVLPVVAQTKLPSDPLPTCPLTLQEWQSWQSSDAAMFKPANSTTFDDETDCNFYKWGAQMFLWITSPTSDGLVYDGPDFYDVSFKGEYGTFVPQGTTPKQRVRVEKTDNDTGVAQTGGNGVLISTKTKNKDGTDAIVHYGVKANNVFAYYRTGQFQIAFDKTLQNYFPTDANDLAQIAKFMKSNFQLEQIANGEALAMELKSSWVEAETLGDVEDVKKRYITSEAVINTFKDESDKKWPQTGTKTALMAMVGIHIVGSVKDHPEMVWATFEHIDNAPQNGYVYLSKSGKGDLTKLVAVPYDGTKGSEWIFNNDPVIKDPNKPVRRVDERSEQNSDGDIVALKGQTIGPDKVVRLNPWGDAPADLPKYEIEKGLVEAEDFVETYGSSNAITRATDLISLNNAVISMLPEGDVRRNYIQTGSIWSSGGEHAIPTSGTDPNLRGNLQLANSTMETYHQYPDSHSTGTFRPKNCFGCHSINSEDDPGLGVSHLFGDMLPLESVD